MNVNGVTHTDEELVRDLMRGNRSEFKRGYTAQNAAIAVQETKGLTEEARELLAAHGLGFRDGVALVLDPDAPVTVTDEHDWSDEQHAAYQRGLDRGRNERVPQKSMLG